MLSKPQKLKIKKALTFPYIFLFILWFLLFLFINIYFNEIYVIGFSVFNYGMKIYIPFVFFTFLNTFLIALSINLIILKIKEVKSVSPKGGIFGTIGTFFALLTGACPGCVAGIFPVFMGMFGSNFTLISLPFNGLELQITSFVFLLLGIYFLSKDMTCKIKIKN